MKALAKHLKAINHTFIATLLTFSAMPAISAAEVPRLQFVFGDVKAIDIEGKLRTVKKGDALLPGERLKTGAGGMAQLRLLKQGVVAVHGNSQFGLDSTKKDTFAVSLNKGKIRTVTALAKKTGQIDIKTPGATIAVKGADTQTAVGLLKKDGKNTLNQVLAGDVEIKTGGAIQTASLGKTLQIGANGRDVKILEKTPDVLVLKITPPKPTPKEFIPRVPVPSVPPPTKLPDIVLRTPIKPIVPRTPIKPIPIAPIKPIPIAPIKPIAPTKSRDAVTGTRFKQLPKGAVCDIRTGKITFL